MLAAAVSGWPGAQSPSWWGDLQQGQYGTVSDICKHQEHRAQLTLRGCVSRLDTSDCATLAERHISVLNESRLCTGLRKQTRRQRAEAQGRERWGLGRGLTRQQALFTEQPRRSGSDPTLDVSGRSFLRIRCCCFCVKLPADRQTDRQVLPKATMTIIPHKTQVQQTVVIRPESICWGCCWYVKNLLTGVLQWLQCKSYVVFVSLCLCERVWPPFVVSFWDWMPCWTLEWMADRRSAAWATSFCASPTELVWYTTTVVKPQTNKLRVWQNDSYLICHAVPLSLWRQSMRSEEGVWTWFDWKVPSTADAGKTKHTWRCERPTTYACIQLYKDSGLMTSR